MGSVLLIASVALIAWGVVLGRQHIAEHHAIARFKFENRTSGGVVMFKDYDASVDFKKREMRQALRAKLFVGVVVVGVFCLLGAFLAFKG